MKLSEFDYDLPKELIAQYPTSEREKCRLMVLNRESQRIEHRIFEDIVEHFEKGDGLVLNDTKVIPARLFGRRKSGGRVELFLLEKKNPVCEALIRPSRRLKEGERITLESGDEAEILNRGEIGTFVRFKRPIDEILKEAGHVPLPPYISRDDEKGDRESYQTVYAEKEGATASPTAGLHFTRELLDKIRSFGRSDLSRPQDETRTRVSVKYVTLHTSYGTFAPIKTDDVEQHKMHKEHFELPADTAKAVRETKSRGGKIFAVGTTTTRVLEYCADLVTGYDNYTYEVKQVLTSTTPRRCNYGMTAVEGYTSLFIYPPYHFKVVDSLITNFHLPKSTLLLLVSAFAGKEFIFEAYRKAIEMRYRFFSYGDAMLII